MLNFIRKRLEKGLLPEFLCMVYKISLQITCKMPNTLVLYKAAKYRYNKYTTSPMFCMAN